MTPSENTESHLEEQHAGPAHLQFRRGAEDRDRTRRKLLKKRERDTLRPQIDSAATSTEAKLQGRVIRAEGAFFEIQLMEGEQIRAKTYKGTLTANPNATLVAVGDRVTVVKLEGEDAVIESVDARQTKLARQAAGRRDTFEQVIVSNIDTLMIVTSALEPPFRAGIVDRYIVAGLEGGLDIVIVINKMDLVTDPDYMLIIKYYLEVYTEIGYPTILASSVDGTGLHELREVLHGKTTVLAGHSGIGKSSIINALAGTELERTGALSKKFHRGAHTTSASVLLRLGEEEDTFIVDTPGVREFTNFEPDTHNLKFYFVEFGALQEHCRIGNCSHTHEPDCAVRAAAEKEIISMGRYESYVKLYDEAEKSERKRLSGSS